MPIFFALLLGLAFLGESWEEAARPSFMKDVTKRLKLFVSARYVDVSMVILASYMVVCALQQS